MALSRKPRKTEGYHANQHTQREKQWYAALSEKVGHLLAPEYADHIINWRQCRPPDHMMKQWLIEHDEGKWEIDPAIRTRVENKVDRFHKQEHMSFMRRMLKGGNKAIDAVVETGDMKQPVILKYIADGVNQGFLLHASQREKSESLNVGGLTINIGSKPPPRKLKQKDVDQIINADFKVLPEKANA